METHRLHAVYFMAAFNSPTRPFWGPVISFLFSWVSVLLLRTSAMAIATLSFATYSVAPVMRNLHFCDLEKQHYTLTRLTAALCICKSPYFIEILT